MRFKKNKTSINICFSLAFFCIIYFIINLSINFRLSNIQSKQSGQSLAKLSFLKNIYFDVKSIESGQRGYLISGNPVFLESYNRGFENLKIDKRNCINSFTIEELKTTQFDSIVYLIDKKISFSKKAVEIKNVQGEEAAQNFISTGKGVYIMNQIDAKIVIAENYFLNAINDNYIQNNLISKNIEFDILLLSIILLTLLLMIIYLNNNKHFLQKELSSKMISIDNISDAIITTDKSFNITNWNENATKIFGYEEKHLIGKNIIEVLKVKSENINLNEIIEHFKKQKIWKGELLNENSYGQVINVEVAASALLDNEGENIGTISVIRNISSNKNTIEQLESEIKKNNIELKIKNERLELINKASNEAVWDWDLHTNKIWGNDVYLKMLNKTENDDNNYNDFVSKIHPNDLEILLESFTRVLKEKKSTILFHYRILKSNGDWARINNKSIVLYDLEGNAYRSLGVAQDVTEFYNLKIDIELEKEISENIINTLPGIFYVFNKEGKYHLWNNNLITITGYSVEELLQTHPLLLIADIDRDLVAEKIKSVFINGHDTIEALLLLKNNQEIPYLFSGKRIHYNNEDCIMGIGFDITEKSSYQKKLKEFASNLQKVREEERTRISREIHDELGQQLIGLKMELSSLKNNINNDIPFLLNKLNNSIAVTDNSLIALRNISTQLRPSLLDDLGLIPAIEWQTEEFEKRFNIKCSFYSNQTTIYLNEEASTAIFRMYQECLTNILKHSQATKVIASLNLDKNILSFEIVDNGVGLNVNTIETKGTFGILGIRERVSILNGNLQITSSIGIGTTIRITISI